MYRLNTLSQSHCQVQPDNPRMRNPLGSALLRRDACQVRRDITQARGSCALEPDRCEDNLP
jgi:hypothetical protein